MVVADPFFSVRPSKAPPQPMLPNDCTGWDTTSSLFSNFQPHLHIPYQHYALIYFDNTGKLRVQESQSIRDQNRTLFSSGVQERFLDVLGSKIGYRKPLAFRHGRPRRHHDGDLHAWSSNGRMKRRRSSSIDSSSDETLSDSVEDLPSYSPTDMIELEIGDTEKVVAYYETVLKRFQQVNCRNIAKAFIKVIEPRKQVKYPYNGGRTGNPELTKPPWWPAGIMHKEPDHLKMEFRVPLLMHILRNLGGRGVTASMLKEIAHDTKKTLKGEGIETLKEVFRVRKLEERFERGEVDPTTKVYVLNYNSNSAKRRKSTHGPSEPDQDDDDESIAGPITPESSIAQTRAQSTTTVDNMTIAADSRPYHFENDRNSLFQLPGPLGLEGQARQDRSYYPTTTEYSDGFPAHDVLRAPASSGVLGQNDQSGFDYLTQTTFPTPGSETPISPHCREPQSQPQMSMHSSPDHLQHWNLRPSYFGSVDYSTAPPQTIAPAPISYPLSVSGPAHHTSMAHSFPQVPRGGNQLASMSVRSPQFRTGSLSHPNTISHPLNGSATNTLTPNAP